MNIQHEDDSKYGVFFVEANGERLAEMTYSWKDANTININHTEVSAKLEGKGVGKQLIDRAVQFAREKNIKIMATCPFASAVLQKVEKYHDVFKV